MSPSRAKESGSSRGDWVESLTALSEDADGHLRLVGHDGRVQSELAPTRPPLRLAWAS